MEFRIHGRPLTGIGDPRQGRRVVHRRSRRSLRYCFTPGHRRSVHAYNNKYNTYQKRIRGATLRGGTGAREIAPHLL